MDKNLVYVGSYTEPAPRTGQRSHQSQPAFALVFEEQTNLIHRALPHRLVCDSGT